MNALPVERLRPMPSSFPSDPQSLAELPLEAQVTAPASARKFAEQQLNKWGLDELIEPCKLVISELINNGVEATHRLANRSAIVVLRLHRTQANLVCEVWDCSTAPPRPSEPDETEERGRGLILVSSCCAEWGFTRSTVGGKTVWASWDLR